MSQEKDMSNDQPNQPTQADVVVVGAGHNGLVAACYLARAGLHVVVVEAHATPGGMTSTNEFLPEAPGYTINEASIQASLFRTTTIDADLGLSRKYGLKQTVIDPAHVQMAPDGSSLALWRDPMRTAEELKRFSARDVAPFLELYEVIEGAVEIGLPFLQASPTRPALNHVFEGMKAMAKNRGHLRAIGRWATMSQAEALDDSFESDMIKAPLLTSLPFMPFDADISGWSLIYLGVLSKYGVSMFHGGTGSLPKALIGYLEDHGGQVICGAPVTELSMQGGRVTGVVTAHGDEISATHGVMTACSPKTTFTRLLPADALPRELKVKVDHIPTLRRGITDAKVNVALTGKIQMTKHQKWRSDRMPNDDVDLRLGANCYHSYAQALDAAKACVRGDVPDHIPGLAQVTTAFDESFAPQGTDVWWFWTGLTPAIPRDGWELARKQLTESILRDAEEYYEGVESLQLAVRPLMNPDIEQRFNAIDGNVYHVDPMITRFANRKPAPGLAGYATPVPGLFLTGSGTHPTAGVSGMPGQNAATAMLKVLRRERDGWRGRLGIGKDRDTMWNERVGN